MPNTFGELIDSTISALNGLTTDLPVLGTLSSPMAASSTSFTVDFGSGPDSPRPNTRSGLIEIDSELLQVTRFDPSSNTATVAPWGRGVRGTTAVDHAAGAKVTVSPRYPRKLVGDELNQVIAGSCPPLFAVNTVDPITITSEVAASYPLPKDTIRVLTCTVLQTGVDEPIDVRNWRVDRSADAVSLVLPRNLCRSTVTVTVAVEPGVMGSESEDFIASTGLSAGCQDVAKLAAIARLVSTQELTRQQMRGADATSRLAFQTSGSGSNVSKYYQALAQQRLQMEARRLQERYPLIVRRNHR